MHRKVAVVTGSSSGIGAATARLFAGNGYNVVINFSRDPGPANSVADECRALGSDVLVVQANVADDEQCRALADAVENKWGRCDALVNNAGTTKFVAAGNLEGLSAQDFQDIYAVNRRIPDDTGADAADEKEPGRGHCQHLVGCRRDGSRLQCCVHGIKRRAQCNDVRPGPRTGPGDPGQCNRSRHGRDAVAAEWPRRGAI